MNSFYRTPLIAQWFTAILLSFVGFIAMGSTILAYNDNILLLPLIWIVVPVLQFCFTPISKLTGMYQYLSPMLLVYMPNKKKYDIHNGTSFDYLFVMWGSKAGPQTRKRILAFYLEGLLVLCDRVESEELSPDLLITGTSYFFSERTAKRFGFETSEGGWFVKFNIAMNYLDLLWMYSLAHGRLRFPGLKNVTMASITAGELVMRKDDILRYHGYLLKVRP